mgnify:CR=1 FL=1|uniref:Capsid n=2 Tax=unclassified Picobirnaviridae TaxID=1680129 RepID=A0A2Z4EVI7_9VIRU|nr:capsid [Lysoka partiti-like virus]AWV67016.1 capsid [Lysoka partitivirus]AWV67018.1 capsid [Lysoka partitivirus]AWV67020.1 capsid [Lysoka partitivirus]
MATHSPLFEELIGDGRLRIVPYHTYLDVTVLTVNLDILATRLKYWLHSIYDIWEPLRLKYSGTAQAITQAIHGDIDHLVDYALWVCYNRLRMVAERYSPTTRIGRMNPKAPTSARMEFPTFVSTLLQTIGPLRVTDGAVDVLLIYAPPPNTMQNFGRMTAQQPDEPRYARLLSNLRSCGVACSAIDIQPNFGSFWTTCQIEMSDGLFDVVGTVHPSHYENEDAIRAAILDVNPTNTPFESTALTVGYVNDETTLNALASVEAPADIPAGQTATSAGRPSGLVFNSNYYGIQPAVPQTGSTPAQPRGCYIVGRGTKKHYSCYIAQHITAYELYNLMRFELTRQG